MKLKTKVIILFLIILFTILQCTALNYIQILKSKPDILLILIIFFSLHYGRIYGLTVGALCGFFSEATSGIPGHLAVFTYSLGGLFLGHLGRWIWNQKIVGQLSTSFVFSLAIYLFLFFLFKTFQANLSLFSALVFIILPASFYTAAVSPVLFRFLKLVFKIK